MTREDEDQTSTEDVFRTRSVTGNSYLCPIPVQQPANGDSSSCCCVGPSPTWTFWKPGWAFRCMAVSATCRIFQVTLFPQPVFPTSMDECREFLVS